MASIAMMVGGALVNALAFSGSNFLFSKMGDSGEERVRHDKAMEKLQAAQEAWSKKRMQRLDFINRQLQKEHHAQQTFDNVDQAMKQYYYTTGKQLDSLPPEPKLSDFYTPSPDQQNRELVFIALGMGATAFVAYKFM